MADDDLSQLTDDEKTTLAALLMRTIDAAAALAARGAHRRVSDRKIAARCPDVPCDQIEC